MAQNYAARSVTQVDPSAVPARVTRSTATVASLAQISGLKATDVAQPPPLKVMDGILALPLHELYAKLEKQHQMNYEVFGHTWG